MSGWLATKQRAVWRACPPHCSEGDGGRGQRLWHPRRFWHRGSIRKGSKYQRLSGWMQSSKRSLRTKMFVCLLPALISFTSSFSPQSAVFTAFGAWGQGPCHLSANKQCSWDSNSGQAYEGNAASQILPVPRGLRVQMRDNIHMEKSVLCERLLKYEKHISHNLMQYRASRSSSLTSGFLIFARQCKQS